MIDLRSNLLRSEEVHTVEVRNVDSPKKRYEYIRSSNTETAALTVDLATDN